MRKLRDCANRAEGQRLVDALYAEGIEASLRGDDETPALWVHDDGHLERAAALVDAFMTDSAAIGDLAKRGKAERKERARREKADSARNRKLRDRLDSRRSAGVITSTLILGFFGMTALVAIRPGIFETIRPDIEATLAGEVWRPLTALFPIALGGLFSYLGLFFTPYFLIELLAPIERIHGAARAGLFVLLFAALANFALPAFGIMTVSLGPTAIIDASWAYLFTRERLDPRWPMQLPRTLTFIIVFFALFNAMQAPMFLGGIGFAMIYGHLVGRVATSLSAR